MHKSNVQAPSLQFQTDFEQTLNYLSHTSKTTKNHAFHAHQADLETLVNQAFEGLLRKKRVSKSILRNLLKQM